MLVFGDFVEFHGFCFFFFGVWVFSFVFLVGFVLYEWGLDVRLWGFVLYGVVFMWCLGVWLVVFGIVVVHLLVLWVCFDDVVVDEGVGVCPVVVWWDGWFVGDVWVFWV